MAAADTSKSQAFVAGVNEARASHGLRPLRVARSLQRSSVGYARWMLDNQRFEHPAAIRAPGYFRLRGEVLARAAGKSPPVARIVRQWLASPSHRAVVLEPSYRFVGVGLAYGRLGSERGTLVTGHFGAR
ncbi:MAG: CAP domain-containing protein [Actinomycetota bacterium]|nr:CAP domain-containing protein [Actinomycetota bacterium]